MSRQATQAVYGMLRRVMFLCSGNYYRSRICEELFNSIAAERNLDWTATSRALCGNPSQRNPGPMSPHAIEMLGANGVRIQAGLRLPLQVTRFDFEFSSIVIAANEREHRPLIETQWSEYAGRVDYWQVPDVEQLQPSAAFERLLSQTTSLISLIGARREQGDAA